MKEWMVGVNGTYWKIKADSYHLNCGHGDQLAKAVFWQGEGERAHKVGEFAGEMVIVFDPECIILDPNQQQQRLATH